MKKFAFLFIAFVFCSHHSVAEVKTDTTASMALADQSQQPVSYTTIILVILAAIVFTSGIFFIRRNNKKDHE